MKKFLLAGVVIMFALTSQAQFRIGAKAGVSFSDQKRTGGNYSTNMLINIQAGVAGEVKISDNLYLQPQLILSGKGATHVSPSGLTKTEVAMNYAELPVSLVYKKETAIGKIFAGAGPVIGYGFGGKLKQNGDTKKLYSEEIKNFKHGDLSANFIAGFEFPDGLFVSAGYQYGFIDIYKTEEIKIQNRTTSISVGYFFGNKKIK